MIALNAAPYPCLWCKDGVEEPEKFYLSVFPKARKLDEMIAPEMAEDNPGHLSEGDRMTALLELNGQRVMLLNGGGHDFPYNESVSLVIDCGDQAEVDHYWTALQEGGRQESQCGWLKDRFGMSWQVTPVRLVELLTGSDQETAARVMQAMLGMRKLDIAALEQAAAS